MLRASFSSARTASSGSSRSRSALNVSPEGSASRPRNVSATLSPRALRSYPPCRRTALIKGAHCQRSFMMAKQCRRYCLRHLFNKPVSVQNTHLHGKSHHARSDQLQNMQQRGGCYGSVDLHELASRKKATRPSHSRSASTRMSLARRLYVAVVSCNPARGSRQCAS